MRFSRLIVFVLIALAVGGCMGRRQAPPPVATAPRADLDSMAVNRSANAALVRTPTMATPPPGAYTRAQAQVVAPPSAPPYTGAIQGPPPAPVYAPTFAPKPAPQALVVTANPPPPDIGPAGRVDVPYSLDSGDKLRIVVFGQEGLSNTYLVDVAGNITMPLIGLVRARALTTQELAGEIAHKLRQGFIREPHVAIEVETYRPFFILGEVTAPGQYAYVPNMTVETAVAVAGGFSARALRGPVELSRPLNGQTVRIAAPLLYRIRPGDTIVVKERWF
jgi:polysaccharide export outer membrane protein